MRCQRAHTLFIFHVYTSPYTFQIVQRTVHAFTSRATFITPPLSNNYLAILKCRIVLTGIQSTMRCYTDVWFLQNKRHDIMSKQSIEKSYVEILLYVGTI